MCPLKPLPCNSRIKCSSRDAFGIQSILPLKRYPLIVRKSKAAGWSRHRAQIFPKPSSAAYRSCTHSKPTSSVWTEARRAERRLRTSTTRLLEPDLSLIVEANCSMYDAHHACILLMCIWFLKYYSDRWSAWITNSFCNEIGFPRLPSTDDIQFLLIGRSLLPRLIELLTMECNGAFLLWQYNTYPILLVPQSNSKTLSKSGNARTGAFVNLFFNSAKLLAALSVHKKLPFFIHSVSGAVIELKFWMKRL